VTRGCMSRFFARTLAAAAAALLIAAGAGTDARADAARPNIVLIVSDDEDVAIHAHMPKTKALIEDQGTRFDRFFVSYPLCCPSRASILRGQYAHNTGVVGNIPPLDGYATFRDLGREESTLATWLSAAGYRTALVGKYLNGYLAVRDPVPPGWSDWHVADSGAHPSYNYWLNENGRRVFYGEGPEHYLNDVLTTKSVEVIRSAAAADQPFFLYVLPLIPHSPSVAAPRHVGAFADAELPRGPAWDEAEISDKPALIQALPRHAPAVVAHQEAEYRRRLDTMLSLDDMVGAIVDTLAATHELDNTYIIYTSDNGFSIGDHRLPTGKLYPYESNLRVPAVMRGPGVPKGRVVDAMVLNSDLTPSLAELAGVTPPDFVDGRSFLPLFENPQAPWRQSFLIERRQLEPQLANLARKAGVSEPVLDGAAVFDGLRWGDMVYVEYGTGERELYDLAVDPHQLSNLASGADPTLLGALSARVAELAACAGAECRRLEDLPVVLELEVAGAAEPKAPETIAAD
jgi:N-acetylglucosamine-6-sulfatase